MNEAPQLRTMAEIKRDVILRYVRLLGPIGAAKQLKLGKTSIYRLLGKYGHGPKGRKNSKWRKGTDGYWIEAREVVDGK